VFLKEGLGAQKAQFFLVGEDEDEAVGDRLTFQRHVQRLGRLHHRHDRADVVDDALGQGSVAQLHRIIVGGQDDVLVALAHRDDDIGAFHRAGGLVAAFEDWISGVKPSVVRKPTRTWVRSALVGLMNWAAPAAMSGRSPAWGVAS
jgi:hypothetical protein